MVQTLGIPLEAIFSTIGLSLPETFAKLAGQKSEPQSQEFTRLFKYHADKVMADLTVIYPPVAAVTRKLKQPPGQKLGIVSTKFRYRIERILARENLQDMFDVIVGGEDVSTHKPDPEGLKRAIGALQSTPDRTLYVGDSIVDAETAYRAQVPFVAVLSGVTERKAFENFPALCIIDDVSQLPKQLDL